MRAAIAILGVAAALAVSGSGCAWPKARVTGRAGLLDRMAEHQRAPAQQGKATVVPAHGARALRGPLEVVEVTSFYGKRKKEFHEGIDLRAPKGTAVHAAAGGTVLYADRKINGYGYMVVIKHDDGISTVYAHNSKLLVKAGQKVRNGQKIAYSGSSGRAKGAHLHFEVREGVSAVDPISVMPPISGKRPVAWAGGSAIGSSSGEP
jgi:murein DD-endopeptidase MepM/ murein hydrolase activator NlpD